MKRNICAFDTYDAMSRAAAALMLETVRKNPRAVLVLATGHSPLLAYRYLAEQIRRESLDVSAVTWVKLDEWLGLPPEHGATCESFLRRELLEPLGISEDRYLGFRPQAEDIDRECARVEEAYSALERVDLVILGIGMNGHLGLNEPGRELSAAAHPVRLDGKTLTHAMLAHAGGAVSQGVTLGMADLFRGEKILLLADGGEKEEGLRYFLNDAVTTAAPVSLLKLHPGCVCMVNRESFPGLEI